MSVAYIDTSAAMKLVFDEPDSEAMLEFVSPVHGRTMVASWLLHAELHCATGRRSGTATLVSAETLATVLGFIELVDLARGDLLAAGAHAPLRTNDAIHLAVALRLGVDELVTYDVELAAAAGRAGIRVVAPR